MKYLLDTNIVLIYLRDQSTKNLIDDKFSPFDVANIPIVSVVSLGEIESIALRNNWGQKRFAAVERFFEKCLVTDIHSQDVIRRYGEIDAYSQGKLKDKPLNDSSRNMGKNDLWIAATASVINAKLLTTDKDFTHLDSSYLELNLITLVK